MALHGKSLAEGKMLFGISEADCLFALKSQLIA